MTIDERTQIYSPNDVDALIVMTIEKCARKCSEYEEYHWKLYQANPSSQQAWDHQTRANAAANCETAILALRSEFLPQPSANPSATKGTGVTPAPDNAKPPRLWDDFHGIRHRLVYNKETKRIDKVRNFDGLVMESFDPPEEYE